MLMTCYIIVNMHVSVPIYLSWSQPSSVQRELLSPVSFPLSFLVNYRLKASTDLFILYLSSNIFNYNLRRIVVACRKAILTDILDYFSFIDTCICFLYVFYLFTNKYFVHYGTLYFLHYW